VWGGDPREKKEKKKDRKRGGKSNREGKRVEKMGPIFETLPAPLRSVVVSTLISMNKLINVGLGQ